MSEESPFKVVVSEDGTSCRVEWDAHYISDEDMQLIAERFDELKRENAELRELVRDLYGLAWPECPSAAEAYLPRIQSLGVEVEP